VKKVTEGFAYDMTDFERGLAMARSFSGRSDEQFLKTQAKGLVRILFAVTPPGDGQGSEDGNISGMAANKKQGESTIAIDVAKALLPVRAKEGVEDDPIVIKRFIERNRRRYSGRVTRIAKKQRLVVTKAAYRQEVKERKAYVGTLASGWAPAARALGQAVPAWIDRWVGRGSGGSIRVQGGSLRVEISNETSWIMGVKDIHKRVQAALDIQGHRMERSAQSYMAEKFKTAGFDVDA
jgi:hypothetical protein